jgi:hypothetical protein
MLARKSIIAGPLGLPSAPAWVNAWAAATGVNPALLDGLMLYKTQQYWCRQAASLLQWSDHHSLARASEEWAIDAAGDYSIYPSGAPAINSRGWQLLEGRALGTAYNTMAGAAAGSPGSLPTGWSQALTGLTREVVAVGTENGLPYVDVRCFGTATGTSFNFGFGPSGASAYSTADTVVGKTWSCGLFVKLIAGVAPASMRTVITEYSAAGSGLVGDSPGTFTPAGVATPLSSARQGGAVTLSNASCARISMQLYASPVVGNSYDFTLRIGPPWYEFGSFLTTPVSQSGPAVTRSADIPQLIGAAATSFKAAKSIFERTNACLGGTTPRLFDTPSSSYAAFASSTSVQAVSGVTPATATIGGGGTYSGVVKAAFGMDAASFTSRANAGTQATSANPWTAGSGAIYLGNNSSGIRSLNGVLEEIAWSTSVKGLFDGATA